MEPYAPRRAAAVKDDHGRLMTGRQRRARTALLVAAALAVALCLCCCALWAIAPRTGARVLCDIDEEFCAGFCRESPSACVELQLTPPAITPRP